MNSIKAGNYIIAGVDTYVMLMDRFMKNNPGYFTSENLMECMSETVNKFLFSFGTGVNYKTKKLSKKHTERFLDSVKKIKSCDFMRDTKLYWDSGGFQVANGAVLAKDMDDFVDKYYTLVRDNPDLYDYAFILDLPPGPGSSEIFSSYDQIEQVNRKSYQKCLDMIPSDIRKKVIYIHHFRTPELYKTWNKFLFDENLADGYEYFGTGGIVANMSSDILIPIIIYTIPLSAVLLYNKNRGVKKFKFHILGGANFVDVFYHKLFSHHIKEYHGIEVDITFDSSAIFKGLIIGRYVNVLDDYDNLVKMSIKSNTLDQGFQNKYADGSTKFTISDKVFEICNDIATRFGFKELEKSLDPIYDPETNSLSRKQHMYLICYVLNIYRKIELMADKFAKEIYPLYTSGDELEFNIKCWDQTRKINQGKQTKKQLSKTASIFKSMKVLEELDMDFNEEIVKKYLASDGISTLGNDLPDPDPNWQ